MKHLILFDLDGTLVETGPGILYALKQAFRQHRLPVPPDASLHRFIGPKLEDSFRDFAGLDQTMVPRMVDTFRVHYQQQGIRMGGPYAGMIEVLRALGEDAVLAVATAKPQDSAHWVLEHFGLRPLFETLVGSDPDTGLVDKRDIIARAVRCHADCDPARTLMIGDRIYDFEGAAAHGIASVAVRYGYGTEDEFTRADHVVDTPGELIALCRSLQAQDRS